MNITDLQALPIHPAADKFPLLDAVEVGSDGVTVPGPLANLADDLARNGCINPLWTYQGQLLDGRNRLAAAALAGLTDLPVREYEGDEPVAFVVSVNVSRRHLSKGGLAVLAVYLEPDFASEAEARSKAGVKSAIVGESLELAARSLGVSLGYAQNAKALSRHSPDLFAKLADGDLTVNAAYDLHKNTFVNPDGRRIPKVRADDSRVIDTVEHRRPDGSTYKEAVRVSRELLVPDLLEKVISQLAELKVLGQAWLNVASEDEADMARRQLQRIAIMAEEVL